MQLAECRELVARMGWTVEKVYEVEDQAGHRSWEKEEYVYVDNGVSGMKSQRPALDRMWADMMKRKFKTIVIWRLDRLGRSLPDLLAKVKELDNRGVRLITVTGGIDTDKSNPTSRLFLHIMAALSEFEREQTLERTKAGIAEARRRGSQFGRPKLTFRRDIVIERRQQVPPVSWRDIGKEVGRPPSTCRHVWREWVKKREDGKQEGAAK